MSRTRKTLVIITGTILLLIVLFFIVLATFDWNLLKPTINQKVSAELNRPFAIRGDLGVVWERQPDERGWRSWIPWPHVHAEDIVLGNPAGHSPGDHDPSAAGGGDPCPAGAAEQNGVPAVDQAGAARRTVDPPGGRQQ